MIDYSNTFPIVTTMATLKSKPESVLVSRDSLVILVLSSSVTWIVAGMASVPTANVPVTVVTPAKGASLRCAMNPSVQRMGSVIPPMAAVSVTRDGMDISVGSKGVQMTVVVLIVVNVLRSRPLVKLLPMVKQLIPAIGSVDVPPVTLELIVDKSLK